MIDIALSLGSHIACKLQSFGSDERTLTDDLCDMFLIWSQIPPLPLPHETPVDIVFRKSTQSEESVAGFDLTIRILGPDGQKEALLQAKVVDPDTNQLRVSTTAAWKKLKDQLVKMRALAPSMFFVLLYVPASHLDVGHFQYSTWEQSFCTVPAGSTIGREFGGTIIDGDDLLVGKSKWCKGKLRIVSPGVFAPGGRSLARFIADLLLCNVGKWEAATDDSTQVSSVRGQSPRCEMAIDMRSVSPTKWSDFTNQLRDAAQRIK